MLLSSAQPYEPSDAFTTEVYQVPYEPDFIEKVFGQKDGKRQEQHKRSSLGFRHTQQLG